MIAVSTIPKGYFSQDTKKQAQNFFMFNFTVAICTYNGEQRLPHVLDKLLIAAETTNKQIVWETIVIDNNSQDFTAQIVKKYQQQWHPDYPLKYYFEPQQGAGYARQKAIQEARSQLIGFLDDDNLPASDWINQAYDFAEKHPKAGAFGSQIHGSYDVTPPANFHRIKAFFAIIEWGETAKKLNPKLKLLPPGAGLVVRKQAWLESIPEKLRLTGRIDGNMLTGEDTEVLAHIQNRGWEIWYNPNMVIEHHIAAHRLTREYLIGFMEGVGLSRHAIRMIGVKRYLKPLMTLIYAVNDLKKMVIHLLRYGTEVKTDLVAAAEWEFFCKSFVSPCYLWKDGYSSRKK